MLLLQYSRKLSFKHIPIDIPLLELLLGVPPPKVLIQIDVAPIDGTLCAAQVAHELSVDVEAWEFAVGELHLGAAKHVQLFVVLAVFCVHQAQTALKRILSFLHHHPRILKVQVW